VVKPVTRRKFGRVVVGTTAGIAGVSGISSATDGKEDQAEPQSNVEVRYDRVVEDGKVYTIALARNKDTDEINSAIFVRPTGSTGSEELNSEQSEMELLDVSDDVVDDVESTVFDNQDEQKASTEGDYKNRVGVNRPISGGPSVRRRNLRAFLLNKNPSYRTFLKRSRLVRRTLSRELGSTSSIVPMEQTVTQK